MAERGYGLRDSVSSRPRATNVAGGFEFSCDDLIRGALSAQAVAALQEHPLLTNAVYASVGALCAITRTPSVIINDLGRLAIGILALYLHYSRDPSDPSSGLTVSRMSALCVEQKVCSKGRALAVVALMRQAGDLVPATYQVDQRLRLLIPTENLIKACRQYWDAIFRGMALVIPRRSDAVAALAREEVFAAFVRVFGGYFCAGARMFRLEAELTPFAQRNAALAILFSLLLASRQDGKAGATIRISIAKLARRFGVSRPQVLRVLDAAVEAKLVERSPADGLQITVLPRLRSVVEEFYVAAFLLCDHYMQVALDQVGRGRPIR